MTTWSQYDFERADYLQPIIVNLKRLQILIDDYLQAARGTETQREISDAADVRQAAAQQRGADKLMVQLAQQVGADYRAVFGQPSDVRLHDAMGNPMRTGVPRNPKIG